MLKKFRFDADDCEVDESEGEDDEVNGNEDGDGDANEDDSEEGWLRLQLYNNHNKYIFIDNYYICL